MNENLFDEFEKKVLHGLSLCKINLEDSKSINLKNPLGAAVSGGADSVSLLVSLSRILEKFNKKDCLEVITVNHGIREKTETDGDALYVAGLCEKIGVHCTAVVFERGKVFEKAEKRRKGTEEAAREMRYNAFSDFIKKKNLFALCLAHNQNDQSETVLMRFLNGSGSEGLCGIPRTRNIFGAEGKIVRPLLEISRAEIESYLLKNKISWRTDSTNFDNHYSRNKIRNLLVPFLNENFDGWKNSVLFAAEKSADDNFFIQKKADEILKNHLEIDEKNEKRAEIDAKIFFSLENSIKRRIIFKILNKIGFGGRFPFKLVCEICSWNEFEEKSFLFENQEIRIFNNKLYFENKNGGEKKSIFSGANFIFTCKNDSFEFGNLLFYIEEKDENTFFCAKKINKTGNAFFSLKESENLEAVKVEISFPFFAGSVLPGEKIRTADGKLKKIADIFSDWKIPENDRKFVPVVRKIRGGIEATAVLGAVFGFENWKVSFSSSFCAEN